MDNCKYCNVELRPKNIITIFNGEITVKCENCNEVSSFDISKYEEQEYLVFAE